MAKDDTQQAPQNPAPSKIEVPRREAIMYRGVDESVAELRAFTGDDRLYRSLKDGTSWLYNGDGKSLAAPGEWIVKTETGFKVMSSDPNE